MRERRRRERERELLLGGRGVCDTFARDIDQQAAGVASERWRKALHLDVALPKRWHAPFVLLLSSICVPTVELQTIVLLREP